MKFTKPVILIALLSLLGLLLYCGKSTEPEGLDPAPARLVVSSTSLSFGATTTSLSFDICNSGDGSFTWTVTDNANWISVTPSSGSCAGDTNTVTVTANRSGLEVGLHEGTVTVSSSNSAGNASVAVTVEVPPVPQLGVDPTSLSFDCETTSQNFSITNEGTGTLTWTVTDDKEWITVSPGSGTTTTETETVSVEVNCAGLSEGTYTGVVSVSSDGGDGTVAITLATGPPTGCSVDPAILAFGTVEAGQSEDLTFTITNDNVLTLSGSVSLGDPCGEFSLVESDLTYSLAEGESKIFTVQFAPTSQGEQTCTVETGAEACADVSCIGEGFVPVDCDVTPTTLDFGEVEVGDEVDRDFTIRNSGSTTFSGDASSSSTVFSIVSGGGKYTLDPGEERTVTVRFAPTRTGSATYTIETGTDDCSDVTCRGDGVDLVECTIDDASLDFGEVAVGSGKRLSFSIQNTGAVSFSGEVSESCPDYRITEGGGAYTLEPNEKRRVSVDFVPTSLGIQECTIETGIFACSDVTCTGEGIEATECSLSPTSLDFGEVEVGENEPLTFTITNDGTTTLSGSVSESSIHYIIASGGGPYILTAGQSRTVTVTFRPQSPGTHTCTIETGTSDCEDVFCTGVGWETAFFQFNNFRKSGSEIIVDFTTNTGWEGEDLRIVAKYGSWTAAPRDPAAGCSDCLNMFNDYILGYYNWIYVDHVDWTGLPIPSGVSMVWIDFTGMLGGEPIRLEQGFFFGTQKMDYPSNSVPSSEWEWCYTIGTDCSTDDPEIDWWYLDFDAGTIIYVWFREPGTLNDGWVCDVKYTFRNWEVSTDLVAPSSGTIRVISEEENR